MAKSDMASGVSGKGSSIARSAQIILSLEVSITQPPKVSVKLQSPGGAGRPSKLQSQPPQNKTIASIILDVEPAGADGFAQQVTHRETSRQSMHQTPEGFYVDQFGMAPGSLSVQAMIAARDSAGADMFTAVEKFRQLLRQAKPQTPFELTPPPVLRYHNAIDGRSLVLTQTELEIGQVAGNPNLAMIKITADILFDYADTKTKAPPGVGLVLQDSGSSALLSYTDLRGEGINIQTPISAGLSALG